MLLAQDPVAAPPQGPSPLGEAADVRTKITRSIPGVDWSNPAWGVYDGDGWSIEFNHQVEGLCKALMLHVRGEGDPVGAILRICADTGWVALDMTQGKVIHAGSNASAGWKKFQRFRQRTEKA